MAQIVGSISTSHVPAIGGALAKHQERDPYWKPFFDAYGAVREWLAEVRPDVVVILHNDHGLNFFLDKMPTFAVGAADTYSNADEGWGIPTLPRATGCVDLSWQIVETLVGDEFDITTCQEVMVDHAVMLPLALLWPRGRETGNWPVEIVPICINTVLAPYPSATRCYHLGESLHRAIASWNDPRRVLIVASGGLSHQLDGTRAGFTNTAFDKQFMQSLVEDPTWITRYTNDELVEKVGTQGIELLSWVAGRGALDGAPVRKRYGHYHVPISNTATGLLVLEPA